MLSTCPAFSSSFVPTLRDARPSFLSSSCPAAHPPRPSQPHFVMTTNATPPSLPSPLSFLGGGGSLGTSLILGLHSSPSPPTLLVSSPRLSSLSHLPLPPSSLSTSNLSVARSSTLVFLCVKPHIAPTVLVEIAPAFQSPTPPALVSLVAGLTTSAIANLLPEGAAVLRAMPNLPARERAAVTALCAGAGTDERHLHDAASVLACVGDVELIPEHLFPAFTAVAGSGVAYVFMAAEALADAAVAHGLGRDVANRVAAATVRGAGESLRKGEHPAVLRNKVESPGGVTVRATAELERSGFRASLLGAVDCAVRKVVEMEEEV